MNVTNVVDCIAPATNTCFYRLFEYYAPLENTVGAISIAVGLFTTYIILRHSTKEMSTYKWFILHATVSFSTNSGATTKKKLAGNM